MTNAIGEKIKSIRLRKGVSQGDVAAHLSMSQSAYAKIENGITKLDTQRLLKIADFLETDPTEILFTGSDRNVTFNNNTITNGYVENVYSGLEEKYEQTIDKISTMYERVIKNLMDEIKSLKS